MKPIHWLAVIPFIGMLIGPAVHNEVDPFILGMPFPLGWISVWVVLTAIIMARDLSDRSGEPRGRAMTAALALIALAALAALALGLVARGGRDMDLEQWAVGGRGFGWILVFLLLAGEIYTTFTFLGASGFSYGLGAPVYYILAYGSLAYVIAYFLLPLVWSYGRQHGLHSQPDFFVHKYASPSLGVLVSIVDLVALIPYLVLQLTGLGIIVTAAGYGAIPKDAAIWIGAAIVTVYVMMSGIRGSAYTAVVKDILILGVVLFLGIYLPSHLYGGIGPMLSYAEKSVTA